MSSTNDLHQAIIDQDVPTIKRILAEEVCWKPMADDGETVLHLVFKCKYRIALRQESIVETLECLLNEGLSINLKNAAGQTILFLAIDSRLRHVTDFLVQHGANVNMRDQDGNSIVHVMIKEQSKNYSNLGPTFQEFLEQDHINTLTWLLSIGVNVHLRNNDGETAFNLAIQQNLKHILPTLIKHMNDVNHIVEDGSMIVKSLFVIRGNTNTKYHARIINSLLAFVDHVDKKGSTLVHTFLKRWGRNSRTTQRVLQHYTNVNAQDQDGNTALYLIIRNSTYEQYKRYTIDAIRTLLSKGANVNLKNRTGDAPVRLAIRVKNFEVLKVLLENGADVNPSTHPGAHFLHHVSNVRKVEDHLWAPVVDTLVRAGWNVNSIRRDGEFTPLMEASRAKNLAVAQKLIDNGANVNYFGKKNLTRPIHVAVMASYSNRNANTEALIEMLAKAGAMVNVKNRRGETALHLVVHCGYNEVATLLKLGAHVDARDKEGRSPLQEAIKIRNVGAIEALLKFGADVNDARVLRELNTLFSIIEQVNDELQRRTNIFFSSFTNYRSPERSTTADCLTRHWLKLKAANLPVLDGYVYFTRKDSLQEFYIECLREVETLKTNNLNDLKLFDLLHMDVHFKYAFIANNEKLKELVKSPLLQTDYPKYYSCILACYNRAVARKVLIEPAEQAWNELTGIILPDCVEHILAYLDNEDLRVMAGEEEKEEEVKPLKRSTPPTLDEPAKKKRLE